MMPKATTSYHSNDQNVTNESNDAMRPKIKHLTTAMTRMLPMSPMVSMMPKATGTRMLVNLKQSIQYSLLIHVL